MPQIAIGVGLSLIGTVIASKAEAKKSKRLTALMEEQAALREKDLALKKGEKDRQMLVNKRIREAALRRSYAGRGLDTERMDIVEQSMQSGLEGAQSFLDQSFENQIAISGLGTEMARVQAQPSMGLGTQLLTGGLSLAGQYSASSGIEGNELGKYFGGADN